MTVNHTRSALMYQTSVVDKLLSMLLISVLLLASTTSVHAHDVSAGNAGTTESNTTKSTTTATLTSETEDHVNGDVRLAGTSRMNQGRLEVYHNGEWGTVCDDLFDYIDAGVVCNSLGYGSKGTVVNATRYGSGTGQIWLDNVQCVGTETSIADCPHRGWGIHDCHHTEDVAVSCGTSPVQYGPLSNADNFFIVADGYLRNLDQVDAATGTTSQLLPFGTASHPSGLAYDSTSKILYWADYNTHTINRYYLRTRSSAVIYRDPLAVYAGLAIDTKRQKLYYADEAITGGKLGELSTDGTAHRVVYSGDSNSRPIVVVFDDDNRMLYWTDWSTTSPGIYRSSVDRPNPAREALVTSDLVRPWALAVDFTDCVNQML